MLTTTFRLLRKALRKARACSDCYKHLAKAMGGVRRYGPDTPISLVKVLEVNGLYDALWCLRAVPEEQEKERDRLSRLLACDYAEGKDGRVLAIYEKKFPDDKRPRTCIEVSRRYAEGQATDEELASARTAAWAAGWDAWDTWAAWDTTVTALGAEAVAGATLAADAALATVATVGCATMAAATVETADAAAVAVRGTEREWQAERFRERLG